MLKTVELTPKRMTSSGLPCTAPTKEMSALLSALVPVMKWAASREQAVVPVMGSVPREVLNNWKAICRRAHRILQLISKGQCVAEHQELLRTVMEAPESAPMTITDLVRLSDKIKMLSRRQLAHEEKKRHQDWTEWIERDLDHITRDGAPINQRGQVHADCPDPERGRHLDWQCARNGPPDTPEMGPDNEAACGSNAAGAGN